MARKSRLLQVLIAAEDLLLFFNDYFKSTSWIYQASDLPKEKINRSVWHYVDKGVLKKDLSFKKKPRSIYKEISKPWDGYWRIIIYDVEEEKRNIRNNIRYHLKQYDFKCLQRSVWVSPLSTQWIIKQLEKNINEPRNFLSFKAQLSKNQSEYLVGELWSLEEWIIKAELLIEDIRKKGLTKFNRENFWNLILDHPRIPLDLLPRDWPLKKMSKAVSLNPPK